MFSARLGRPGAVICLLATTAGLLPWAALPESAVRAETAPASAVDAAPPAPAAETELTTPTADDIKANIEQIKASTDLDDATKSKVLELYQQAAQELDRADKLAASIAKYDTASQQAPDALKQARAELDAAPAPPQPEVPPKAALAQLETLLSQSQAELAQAQEQLTAWEAEPDRRAARRLEIPEQIDKATKELDAVRKQLVLPPSPDDAPAVASARGDLLKIRAQTLLKEIAACNSERESYNAEDELVPKRRDLAERQVAEKKKLVEAWQRIIHDRRQQEADQQLREAALEKRFTYPELRDVAAENEKLARRVTDLGNEITEASQQIVELTSTQADLKREFNDVTTKVKTLGLTQELGPLLLQYRAELNRRRQRLHELRVPRKSTAAVQMEWLKLKDQRKKLGDLAGRSAEIVRGLDLSHSRAEPAELERAVATLLQNRCDIIDSLISSCQRYTRELTQLSACDTELVNELAREADYIDERVFWVRSTSAFDRHDLAAARDALVWHARPEGWWAVARQLGDDLWSNGLLSVAAATLLATLLAGRRKMRLRLKALGEQAARGNADKMTPTLRALLLTVTMALPAPVVMLFISWRLEVGRGGSDLARALAMGLRLTALLMLLLEFARQVCRGKGLGGAHFGWPETSLKLLRRHLRWLILVGLPLACLAATLHAEENERWRDSLGRLLFMAAMLLVAVFFQRVLRPVTGVLHEFINYRPGGWFDRLHYVCFPLAVGSPLVLAGLAALGYYYTARQLAQRLQATAWLLVAFMVVGALLLRWVLVVRRRLAMRRTRRRRAEVVPEFKSPEGAEVPAVRSAGEAELDLTTINTQTRHLVQLVLFAGFAAGLWMIWADVLPALSFLDVPLWPNGETGQTINVSHLLLALLFVAMTAVAGRNIPGLLEMALLPRLPIEPATRYAITTLSRYVITVSGIVLACVTIGITWAKVHWLVAAVSVGLGFGLQEIFANFVSGLIILFERPVRVGDIVTVDDVTGVVSRIRIRATMITDWDRKELIVPNKEFITGRVLNWTLSDQMNRIVINVGVAYGTDVHRVRELLLKIAHDNPFVLADPAPMASFEGFGDSALNFVLRCYLPNLENRLSVVHDLHANIHNTFQAEGIEIPFPQHDINVRSPAPSQSNSSQAASAAAQVDDGPGSRAA